MLAMNFKNAKYAILAMLLIGGWSFAQPINPWLADGLNRQIQENRNNAQGGSRGPSAAEVRAWHERERKIQAEIAQHRATPYWMAIGRDWVNKGILYPGGLPSRERAVEVMKQSCKSSNCELLATFANSCAVMVSAIPSPQSRADIFIGIDPDDSKAAAKAWQACQAVHGDRQDRCFYSGIKTGKGLNGTAFCTGYDYSVYGHR